MPYLTQTDLDNAIGHPAVIALLDDDGDKTADAAPLASVIARAGAWVDSYMSVAYGGAWPTTVDATTGAYAAILKEAALYKAIQFAYLRKPEFIRKLGEQGIPSYEAMAKTLLDNIVSGRQRVVEGTPAKGDTITGGIVYDTGPRMLVDSLDGTTNYGDL